ncbi:MAG: ribosomal protein S18 acetylase RimI-like enzyme [Desulforhopalus sp.]|jgi:ribosomal protein S18 acetylase RimI-like enzyme
MIRRATIEDVENLLPLLELLLGIEQDFTFDATRQKRGLQLLLQQPSAAIFLAEQDGVVIGMVTGQITISTAEGGLALLVEDLVVAPEYRNKNIARTLLTSLGNWAQENSANRMQLLADANNHKALDFYKKCGWNHTKLICLRKFNEE